MSRDRRPNMRWHLPILIGLTALVGLGPAGPANARPAGRGDDAVVLKGSQVTGMLGAAPGKIVGFAWRKKHWVQVPVQIDQRHTIDVRQLYPPGTYTHIGDDSPAFDLEVYADPKTRSGADGNPAFDTGDELVFMAGDTGGRTPEGAGDPKQVNRGTGVRVAVTDPLDGGRAFLYLFRSGRLRQSAGRDYVRYRFRLKSLAPGQTLRDGYHYVSSSNPEDSSVTTSRYRLHSADRWIEDGLRIRADRATGVNILDREAAQATMPLCLRTEFTFSGRWTEDVLASNDTDTDDEGTYVASIDGPVRAIRSYMGANSGPYTQREHIYYRSHEQNTIFLRVHPMPKLHAWTDYSEAARGMTYRDSKNPGGVPVDGVPDSLVPTTTADITGGYAWQQLAGRQGTVSTVIGADTDIQNASFRNYYLDDAAPGPGDAQCGGDGKAFGSSGFGIVSNVPNTDPRNAPFNNLTVKRIRYFDSPGGGAGLARRYADRVARPPAAKATTIR